MYWYTVVRDFCLHMCVCERQHFNPAHFTGTTGPVNNNKDTILSYEINQFSEGSLIPKFKGFTRRMSSSTVSKAFDISKSASPVKRISKHK